MAGRIPDATLQAIRDRLSLVEFVSSYVQLKRAGRNHLGLCPFHGEKTPSFTVNEERGLFHCFGCGAGGTIFTFLMRIEGIEFPEAVEQLAKRAGVELPARGDVGGAARRDRLIAVNTEAALFFQQALASAAGADARRYLAQRGLRAELIERYGLGFAPSGGGALAAWLRQRQLPLDVGAQLGLIGRRTDGTYYDRFRGRVMFPIRDRLMRPIGFGGRTLGTDEPKYLNSPESPLFHKGDALYGLGEAREAIRAAQRVVVVEGYMDALMLVQEGVPYSVAALGTALSAAQPLRLLRPLGGEDLNVYFFFDGDPAGQKAAKRACAELFSACVDAGIWGRVMRLPAGFDPDTFVRDRGREETLALIEGAQPLVEFFLDSVAPPPGAPMPERARAAEEVKAVLAAAKSEVQFELLAARAAMRLGVDEETFRQARRRTVRPPSGAPAAPATSWPPAEILLVEALAADGDVARLVAEQGTLALFTDATLARAGADLVEAWEGARGPGAVIDGLPAVLASRLAAAGVEHADTGERLAAARDCIERITRRSQQEARRALATELRHAERAGDDASSLAKLTALQSLIRRDGGNP